MATRAEDQSKRSANKQDTNTKASQKNGADAQGNNDWSQKLETLQSALNSDLSTLSSEDANGLIDEWYNLLHKAKEPEIKEIANQLKQLKQHLKSNKATGHEISEVLIEIGEQTANIASEAEKEIRTPVRKLGKQLTKVGNSLGKAEDHEEIEEIDAVVETLEEDLAQVDTGAAVGSIDKWYNLLHKLDDENLQEIATGLKELKQALNRKTSKASDISNILEKLGEQTAQAGQEAKRGFKGPLQRLGKLLSRTGKSLAE
ncbi:hypothetical protein NOS3756_22750 [Nostoc sp. NIES-3756]|uniref:hypothetical protein n=1 Tax=Nostoc sp. NIES-3756 TaxID=1751286 RepID=UPI00071EDFFC|nr:hypothetical protein [Nostoc sp. NIES-3756]BAT53316.1 hypothetical protein NOS3756_22750 [Nostoc sp. NIES-3756]BAY38954.1 hypothetical protein NIES2111_33040 [Nostoc sp. NIES-2111]